MTKASVSCAPYFRNYTSIIWLSFMVHMCKMIISPDVAIIFSKFWFLWSSVGLKGKKWSRMTKKCVCHAPYLRTMHHMIDDRHLWYTSVQWWYLQVFFPFFKILFFFQIVGGVKGHKRAQNDKSFRGAPYFRNHTSYDCHLWDTYVKWDLRCVHFFKNFGFLGC